MGNKDPSYTTVPPLQISQHPLSHGPQDRDLAICVMCQGNTEGDHCEQCKDGYFRMTADRKQNCRPLVYCANMNFRENRLSYQLNLNLNFGNQDSKDI